VVKHRLFLVAACSLAVAGAPRWCPAADDSFRIYAPPVDMVTADVALERDARLLPPLPEGVTPLRFRDLHQMPVGPRGLEFSERALALNGQRVRMLGFMVREDIPVRGRLLLAPYNFTLFTAEYGHAEDLPPSVVHVHLTEETNHRVPFTPGLLLLTGVLELGNLEEPDGRVSAIRLRLDPPATSESASLPSLNPPSS
jgi:hypothetical protein